ncbi:MAG: hypothetical protein KDB32_11590 [Planctomycetes bacterium]|nr:hypothetical protein [Planctomycetota bacterium]
MLPACRIGSGFDTAEKRRNLQWEETPEKANTSEVADPPKQPEELPAEALQAPPIVYLLVAG